MPSLIIGRKFSRVCQVKFSAPTLTPGFYQPRLFLLVLRTVSSGSLLARPNFFSIAGRPLEQQGPG